jgi:hypothetical protein
MRSRKRRNKVEIISQFEYEIMYDSYIYPLYDNIDISLKKSRVYKCRHYSLFDFTNIRLKIIYFENTSHAVGQDPPYPVTLTAYIPT